MKGSKTNNRRWSFKWRQPPMKKRCFKELSKNIFCWSLGSSLRKFFGIRYLNYLLWKGNFFYFTLLNNFKKYLFFKFRNADFYKRNQKQSYSGIYKWSRLYLFERSSNSVDDKRMVATAMQNNEERANINMHILHFVTNYLFLIHLA